MPHERHGPEPPRRLGRVLVPTVTLAHGGGGKAMKDLIDDVFIVAFDNAARTPLEDQARLDLTGLAAHGDRLAFTSIPADRLEDWYGWLRRASRRGPRGGTGLTGTTGATDHHT